MDKRKEPIDSRAVNIFEFEDAREFLSATFSEKQQRNPRFSLRAWSRQLGFAHPSYLSAVLRGSRRLKVPLAKRISENLKLNGLEERHLSLLVMRSNARSDDELDLYARVLKETSPPQKFIELGLDRFRLIADWYHLTILEMMRLSDFRPEIDFIFERLGKKVPHSLIKSALARLTRLGLIRRTESGEWARTDSNPKVGDQGSSEAIRGHHLQMLEKAKRALHEQDIEERDFRGSTFVLPMKNRKRAWECIQRFHSEMRKLAETGDGDEVYRFNTQLFCLTERKKP